MVKISNELNLLVHCFTSQMEGEVFHCFYLLKPIMMGFFTNYLLTSLYTEPRSTLIFSNTFDFNCRYPLDIFQFFSF